MKNVIKNNKQSHETLMLFHDFYYWFIIFDKVFHFDEIWNLSVLEGFELRIFSSFTKDLALIGGVHVKSLEKDSFSKLSGYFGNFSGSMHH